jgi:hypothetical protein
VADVGRGPRLRRLTIATAALVLAGATGCSATTETTAGSTPTTAVPSTPSTSQTPRSTPTPAAQLPASTFANGCVRDQQKRANQFLHALDDMGQGVANVTREDALASVNKIRVAAYWLALNAGAMEGELEKGGPVRNGARCLHIAATTLRLIAGLFPPESRWYRATMKRAVRFFKALVRYYPDTAMGRDAGDALFELT